MTAHSSPGAIWKGEHGKDGQGKPQGDERRAEIVEAIKRLTDHNGHAPTVREIMREVGIKSSGSVSHHLGLLRRAGRIRSVYGAARTLQVVEPEPSSANQVAPPVRLLAGLAEQGYTFGHVIRRLPPVGDGEQLPSYEITVWAWPKPEVYTTAG